jgi:type II secretion system protein D
LTTDPDTSQVIVLAPPDIQAIVASELNRPLEPGSAAAAGLPPVLPARRAASSLQLTRVPLTRIELQLRQMLGSRLEPRPQGRNDGPDFVLVKGTRRVEMSFERPKNTVHLLGDPTLVTQITHLLTALDVTEPVPGVTQQAIRIIPLQRADPAKVQEAVDALRQEPATAPPVRPKPAAGDTSQYPTRVPVRLVQFAEPAEPAEAGQQAGAGEPGVRRIPTTEEEPAEPARQERRLRQLGDNVEIETLPDLDVIILRGRDPDVDEVARIIAELERLSAETIPELYICRLRYVNCLSLVQIIDLVAEDLIGGRQGKIHITPLVKPNAVLLIGWGEAVTAMKELIAKLDMPVSPQSQIRVYRLRHAPATSVQQTIAQAFPAPQGLGPRVEVTVDNRTNSLIVRASPGDLAEVDLLIGRIDQGGSAAVNQARIFKLKNTLAADLATTLQNAITSAAGGAGDQASAVLELLTADVAGRKLIKSGLLQDVIVTPDPHTNSLLVTAPADSMDLMAALIDQLDTPTAVAQIKVFKIVNGDATSLVEMLRVLLPAEVTVAGPQLASAEGETNLVPVRFSVDARTNSIIATGSQDDLAIIEALLLRLDEEDVEQRVNTIYRLKNAPAGDVATAINEFLRSERVVQQAAPGLVSPFEQIEREVIVVPEPVSNSLIISATPRFSKDIQALVEKLDEQPAQVMIQVVIAEVQLDNADEFGVELGLQDSVLFDRSLLSDLLKVTTTTIQQDGGNSTTTQEDTIIAANNTPGFDFNGQPLGNAGSEKAFASSDTVGTQGLSTFNLGRLSSDLDYGGLVLSASSDSVSVLIRALQQRRCIEVLGRPQIMTLDNQPAFIQVGERVPRIIGSRFDGFAQTNQIELENTGLILGVTPRISPEGMVVMEIDAEKSKVNPIEEGIPVSVVNNQTIRSPTISVTQAQTTVSATSGETIVMGGLITKENRTINRRVPFLSDIPILGHLFRYDSSRDARSELLIFLTPRVVRSSQEMERIKQQEAARMHWCLADVHEIHGPTGLFQDTSGGCLVGEGEVVFPDTNPEGLRPGEFAPRPVPMERLDLWPRVEQLPTPAETRGENPPPMP